MYNELVWMIPNLQYVVFGSILFTRENNLCVDPRRVLEEKGGVMGP